MSTTENDQLFPVDADPYLGRRVREGNGTLAWHERPMSETESLVHRASASTTVKQGVIRNLIEIVIGEKSRQGLDETPARAVKAWAHWMSGYDMDPSEVLKTFEDGAEGYNDLVIVKDIPIFSKCEHHLADIFGTATIGYVPNGRIVGLSKFSRLADGFARRLQVQERLTGQIANAISDHLQPRFVGVIIKARHMCMESRGICQQGHHTITQSMAGPDVKEWREEFHRLAL